jgi:15-cis-phytoene synthase
MLRRHDPTYFWAVRRLPADVRPAVHALYGFVRGADEIVDGPNRPRDPADRLAALDRWEAELVRGVAAGDSAHPVIAALVDATLRHALPVEELSIYMDSMRIDCGEVRIATRAELDRYMRGSAGAVGRIMAAVLDAPPARHEAFERLGTAFQLTNFIRDVRQDYALGRIYLSAEDRSRLGVDESAIARGEATAGFRTLLAEEVARARERFEQGRPAAEGVAPAVRRGMRLARGVYLGVLDRVEAVGYDVLRPRARLAPWRAGAAAILSLPRAGV